MKDPGPQRLMDVAAAAIRNEAATLGDVRIVTAPFDGRDVDIHVHDGEPSRGLTSYVLAVRRTEPVVVHPFCEPLGPGSSKPGEPEYLETIGRMRLAHERDSLEYAPSIPCATPGSAWVGKTCGICGKAVAEFEGVTPFRRTLPSDSERSTRRRSPWPHA